MRQGGRETLSVLPTLGNDYAFRCHLCGFAGNSLQLHWQVHRKMRTWKDQIEGLAASGVFGGGRPDEAWEGRARAWAEFEPLFEKAKARLRCQVEDDSFSQVEDPWTGQFGEAGTLRLEEFLEECHPWAGKLSGYNGTHLHLRLVRTIHGLPAYLALDQRFPGMEFARYYFNDPGPVALAVPEWGLYRDWSTELVAAADLRTAQAYAETLSRADPDPDTDGDPDGKHFAAVWVVDCGGPIYEEIPARRIHYLAGPGETGEFALAFCGGRAEVTVWKTPRFSRPGHVPDLKTIRGEEIDAADFVADRIVEQSETDSHALACLDSMLGKPWVGEAAAASLSAAVRGRLGSDFDALARESGGVSAVLPFAGDSATYLCRNGLYLKAGDRGRVSFRPCSNFSLRIEESSADGEGGALGHRVELRMQGATTRFRIDDSVFQSGPRLMERVTRAALAAGFPHLPNLATPADLRLLPSIVRGTQSPPRSRLTDPGCRGFGPLRFRGPGYRISPGLLVCVPELAEPARCVSMLTPELEGMRPGDESAFLKFRANELASWMCRASPPEGEMIGSVLSAALLWVLRGSQGVDAYLALPTPAHHALFASLVGIGVIELGRARPEHPGVPRVMAASYSSAPQFRRQGRIVAALEATDRRLDNRVTSLLGGVGERDRPPPTPPAPVLSLLAFAAVGQSTPEGAESVLLGLLDNVALRRDTEEMLRRGSERVAPPESYLRLFLERAGGTKGCRDEIVSRSASPGLVLLDTDSIKRLEALGYRFDERRIANELASKHGVKRPIRRYGRARTRVFRIPKGVFGIFDEAAHRRREQKRIAGAFTVAVGFTGDDGHNHSKLRTG